MSKKNILLFSLCMLCGIIEVVITYLIDRNLDVLSVVICSLGILFFILFLISMSKENIKK